MVTTLKKTASDPPQINSGEKRVAMHQLSWAQYRQVLTALPSSRAARLTYSQGTLEISMPLEDHEQASGLIGLFIRILVMEMGLDVKSMWSTTLNREDLDRGAEPDGAYYIHNHAKVAGKTVDLEIDPPPDLVVEVDITHTDIDKNSLYAAMGVPEFWRYDGHDWRIYQLDNSQYQEGDRSPTFSMLEKGDLYTFLDRARQSEIKAETWLRQYIKKKIEQSQ